MGGSPRLALVGSIGPLEIMVVLLVALIFLGPEKLPGAARSLGRAIGEVRRYTTGFQDEMRDAFSEPKPTTRPPPATAAETPAIETPAIETPAIETPASERANGSTASETADAGQPGERTMVTDVPTAAGDGDADTPAS